MDLNLPPPDTNPEGNTPPHSTVGSVRPLTNHEIVVEKLNENQRIPNRMPKWLAHLTTRRNPHRVLKQFQKLHQPAFIEEADPMQAEKWLRQIEQILDVMEYTENQRVSFTTFMFQGEVEQ